MKRMEIEAIYRRPNTSKPARGHRTYPYSGRNLSVARPNQVWAMDITYFPMARRFIYLAAVVDWFNRRVLAWKLSITMETSFCIEALEEAFSANEKTGDIQHRPRQPVHQRGLYRAAQKRRDQHERQAGVPIA
jgi:putative transposase